MNRAPVELSAAEFAAAFPFYFAFSQAGQIVQFGPKLPKMCPGLALGDSVSDRFSLERPRIAFNSAAILENLSQPFLLRCAGRDARLRGQMLARPDGEHLLFLGSPWLWDLQEVESPDLQLGDIALHDVTVELAVLLQAQRISLADQQKLTKVILRQQAELRQANREIEQQKAALAAAEASQKRDQTEMQLLNLVASRTQNAVVITDAEGRAIWINEGFSRLTGYLLPEAKGHLPGALCQGAHSDRTVLDFMGTEFQSSRAFQAELILYHKSGRPFWLSVDSQPVFDASGAVTNHLVIGVDTTDRKRAEDSLRWEKERLWTTLDSIVDGVIVVDQAQRVQLLNRAAEQITGWSSTAAEGHLISEIFVPGDEAGLSIAVTLTTAFAKGEVVGNVHSLRESMTVKSRLGERFTVVPSAVPILGHDGAATGALIIFRDISATIANQRLRQDFVQAVSHELNTPLTSISGFITSLRHDLEMPVELRGEFLGIIDDQVARLRHLVKDILEVSRVESVEANYEFETVDLRQVALLSLQEIHSLATAKGIQVQSHSPETALPVSGDAARLQSVVTNLLSNAIKFTPAHGLVELRLYQQEAENVILVRDTGIGIPPEAREHIFEKFYRVPRPGGMQIPGTGLGLAIVQRIVEILNGRIEVTSIPNEETCFRVFLPAQLPPRSTSQDV